MAFESAELYKFLSEFRKYIATILKHEGNFGEERYNNFQTKVNTLPKCQFKSQFNEFQALFNTLLSESKNDTSRSIFTESIRDIPEAQHRLEIEARETKNGLCLHKMLRPEGARDFYDPAYPLTTIERLDRGLIPGFMLGHPISGYPVGEGYLSKMAEILHAKLENSPQKELLIANIISLYSEEMLMERGSASITLMLFHVLTYVYQGHFNYVGASVTQSGQNAVPYDVTAMLSIGFDSFYDYFKKNNLQKDVSVNEPPLPNLLHDLNRPNISNYFNQMLKLLMESCSNVKGQFKNSNLIFHQSIFKKMTDILSLLSFIEQNKILVIPRLDRGIQDLKESENQEIIGLLQCIFTILLKNIENDDLIYSLIYEKISDKDLFSEPKKSNLPTKDFTDRDSALSCFSFSCDMVSAYFSMISLAYKNSNFFEKYILFSNQLRGISAKLSVNAVNMVSYSSDLRLKNEFSCIIHYFVSLMGKNQEIFGEYVQKVFIFNAKLIQMDLSTPTNIDAINTLLPELVREVGVDQVNAVIAQKKEEIAKFVSKFKSADNSLENPIRVSYTIWKCLAPKLPPFETIFSNEENQQTKEIKYTIIANKAMPG